MRGRKNRSRGSHRFADFSSQKGSRAAVAQADASEAITLAQNKFDNTAAECDRLFLLACWAYNLGDKQTYRERLSEILKKDSTYDPSGRGFHLKDGITEGDPLASHKSSFQMRHPQYNLGRRIEDLKELRRETAKNY